jgi:hypothetical protein
MNTLKACLGAAAGLVVLTLTFTLTDSGRAVAQGMKPLLVQVANTVAEPVPVTTVVPAADRVLLEFLGFEGNACPAQTVPLSRILPDGTVENAFSVPAGRMLVLTDLEGLIRPNTNVGWVAGEVGSLNVRTNSTLRTFLRAYGPFTNEAVSMGMVFLSTHAESGVAVGPLSNLCVSATVNFPNGGGIAEVGQARVHGYLISE